MVGGCDTWKWYPRLHEEKKGGRWGVAAKQRPHRPGIDRAPGLRARSDVPFSVPQTGARKEMAMSSTTGRRVRLGLEPLECREVPASFTAATVPELIAGINAANATPEADTISLAAGKTFTLTAVNNSTYGDNGLPVITPGEDLTVVGNGATVERSRAKGTPAFRLLNVDVGASLALQGLTLQGGLAVGVPGRGGAVLSQGTLILDGVTVQNNVA